MLAREGGDGPAVSQRGEDLPFLRFGDNRRPADPLALRAGSRDAGLGALAQKVALELGDGIQDRHGEGTQWSWSGRCHEGRGSGSGREWPRAIVMVSATSIASRPSRSSLVTTIASPGSIRSQQPGELRAVAHGNATGDCLGDDAMRYYVEASGLDLLELVLDWSDQRWTPGRMRRCGSSSKPANKTVSQSLTCQKPQKPDFVTCFLGPSSRCRETVRLITPLPKSSREVYINGDITGG